MSSFAKLMAKGVTTSVVHMGPGGKRVKWSLFVTGVSPDSSPEEMADCILHGDSIAQPALEREPMRDEIIPTDRKGNAKPLWYSLGDGRDDFAAHMLGDDIYTDTAPVAPPVKPKRKPKVAAPVVPPAIADRMDAPAASVNGQPAA